MAKMTLMDRLARARETLGRRKPTTSYGRIAAAQRWNSLADIGDQRLARLEKLAERNDRTGERAASDYADVMYDLEDMGFLDSKGQRADNPFGNDIPKRASIRRTNFPQPMYRSAEGEYNRYNPVYARDVKEDLGLEMVQGPDMPWALENRRQAMRKAMEEYEAEMAAERERQLLNRRAQAWNEYVDLPRRARQFYPNRDDIARYLVDYDYIPNELEAWKTTRDLPTFDKWSRKNLGKNWPMEEDLYHQYEGPADIPPEFIDEPPWRY